MKLEQASGHDNILIAYYIDARKQEIRLHTGTYPYDNPEKFYDFIFTGVIAYHFECDLLSNIIYEISESTLESTYNEYREVFQKLKPHGWPMIKIRYETEAELFSYLRAQEIRAFELSATMGLTGWIWAQACNVIESS
jgi:hypothetical protein